MNKNKTIVVTGGSGFIGSTLIRLLLETSNNTVVNIDKLTYAGSRLNLAKIEKNSHYFFEQEDICNAVAMTRIFQRYQPDLIMHLAAESHVDRSIDSPMVFVQTNIVGTCTLLTVAHKYWHNLSVNKKKNFVFHHVSTDEVYGDLTECADAFTENTPYAPSSPYSASKAGADHLVRAWCRTYGFPTLITNCSNNYGPYQLPDKLIPLTIYNALNGKPISIYGNGLQIRDWLHVEDHAIALNTVANMGIIGQTYNIGGKQELTNLEVVFSICRLLDEIKPENKPHNGVYSDLIKFVDDRPGHDQRYAINSDKICSELDWQPLYNFARGIRKTVIWYLENSEWCDKVLTTKRVMLA